MNWSERLIWLFGALFILSGATLWFLGAEESDSSASQVAAGTACLGLGGAALCLAWNAWETGAIKLQHFHYRRAAQPRRFMAAVALVLAAGLGTLATAAWFWFFK